MLVLIVRIYQNAGQQNTKFALLNVDVVKLTIHNNVITYIIHLKCDTSDVHRKKLMESSSLQPGSGVLV